MSFVEKKFSLVVSGVKEKNRGAVVRGRRKKKESALATISNFEFETTRSQRRGIMNLGYARLRNLFL